MTSNKTLRREQVNGKPHAQENSRPRALKTWITRFATLISNIFSDILLVAPRRKKTLCVIPESSTSRACLCGPFRQCDRVS